MATEKAPQRNLEAEFDELKSKMDEMVKLFDNTLKMKGVVEEENATKSVIIPAIDNLIYGLPYEFLPEGFSMTGGPESSSARPRANQSTDDVIVPMSRPVVEVVVPTKIAFNPQEIHSKAYTCTNPIMHHMTNFAQQGNPTTMVNPNIEEVKKGKEMLESIEKKQQMLEKQLRLLQGFGRYDSLGIEELSLAPEILLPSDFKLPEFIKYDGTTNPRIHLKAYCTKMGVWSKDEKFFMHFFPESLSGPVADWYWRLEHTKIHSWGQLATLFLSQYSFNENLAPTRTQLEAMRKGDNESFREYAQKWRNLAAQIEPPLEKREMIDYFLRTLTTPFIEMMTAGVYNEFAELVPVGERIEIMFKEGKLEFLKGESPENERQVAFVEAKKRKGGISFINTPRPQGQQHPTYPQADQPRHTPIIFPRNYQSVNPQNNFSNGPFLKPDYLNNTNPPRPFEDEPFPDILTSKAELFRQLLDAHVVIPISSRQLKPPFPCWYNPNVICDYHMGAIGHSIEDCAGFKKVVLHLIKSGIIKLEEIGCGQMMNQIMGEHMEE